MIDFEAIAFLFNNNKKKSIKNILERYYNVYKDRERSITIYKIKTKKNQPNALSSLLLNLT